MQNWNVVTEPNAQVLEDTLHEGNKKRLLVEKLADATGLHRFQHDVQKQTTIISPKGNEKQIDYILT